MYSQSARDIDAHKPLQSVRAYEDLCLFQGKILVEGVPFLISIVLGCIYADFMETNALTMNPGPFPTSHLCRLCFHVIVIIIVWIIITVIWRVCSLCLISFHLFLFFILLLFLYVCCGCERCWLGRFAGGNLS